MRYVVDIVIVFFLSFNIDVRADNPSPDPNPNYNKGVSAHIKNASLLKMIEGLVKCSGRSYVVLPKLEEHIDVDMPPSNPQDCSRILDALMKNVGFKSALSEIGSWYIIPIQLKQSVDTPIAIDLESGKVAKFMIKNSLEKQVPIIKQQPSARINCLRAQERDSLWANSARGTPFFKDGKVVGIRVFAVKEDGYFSRMGFQNGDVIQAVNGSQIKDWDSLRDAFSNISSEETNDIVAMRPEELMICSPATKGASEHNN